MNLTTSFRLRGPSNFAKEDSLPAPQRKASVFHEHDLAPAYEHRFYVRIRVPLAVPVRPRFGYQAIQRAFNVARHIRICTFVDGIPAVVCGTYK